MANLKDLKVRIGSVKSTQKITRAMKMVAASRLRRAQMRAEQAKPYAERMERVLGSLARSMMGSEHAPKLLVGTGSEETHLIILVTSDRGLCGALNSSIVRAAKKKASSLVLSGKKAKFLCVGSKGHDQLRHGFEDKIVGKIEGLGKKDVLYSDAEDIVHRISEMFAKGEFDVCSIVYNKFKSVIEQEVTFQQFIPLDLPEDDNEDTSRAKAVYEYEPSEEIIIQDLLPRNLAVQVYHALLESAASEQGARMSAMDNATRNAGEMIDKLTLVYNRTRQAAITTELIEIIAGAEAI